MQAKDGVLRVFDAASGAELHKLAGHIGRIWDATCDRSGSALSAGADGTLRRWDLGRRTELAGTREVPVAGGAIRDVVAVPDAAVATDAPEGGAAASRDGADPIVILPRRGAPALIDLATGERRDLPAGDTGPSRFLSIDPHGRLFVLHGVDEQTTLHAVDGGPGRSLPTRALLSAWTGSGRLVVADLDRTLSVWDEALERPKTIDSFGHLIDALAPSPPSLELLAVGAGDLVRLHAIPPQGPPAAGGGKTLVRLPPEFGKAYRIAWSHNGERLAVGTGLGRVVVVDVRRQQLLDTFATHPREIVSLAWSPDDRLLFSADQELLRVSDAKTMVMIDEIRPGFDIAAVRFIGGEGAPAHVVIAGGKATVETDDGSDSVACLLVVDLDR